jgi:hypothetical protein
MFYIIVAVVIGLIIYFGQRSAESGRRAKVEEKYNNSDWQLKNDMRSKLIRIGMTEEQVVDSWGRPTRRTVRQLKTKVKVTLHYGTHNRVNLDNGNVVGWGGSSVTTT